MKTAMNFWQTGEYQESLIHFKKAWNLYPSQRDDISYNMMQIYLTLGIHDSALILAKKILPTVNHAIQPDIYNLMGYMYIHQQLYREALLSFKQALIKDPTHEEASFNYELLYKRLLSNTPPVDESNTGSSSPSASPPSSNRSSSTSSSSKNIPTENSELTFFSDSLNIIEAIQILERIQKEEYQYIQQLTKSPRELPINSKKPNW